MFMFLDLDSLAFELYRHAIKVAKVTVQIGRGAQLPFIDSRRTAMPFEQRHRAHECAVWSTEDSAASSAGQSKMPSNLRH
jgi:hypothetical protein